MKYLWMLLSILILNSCASICTVPKITQVVEDKIITFKESEIPCKKQNDFEIAVKQTINVVFSNELEEELDNHIKNNIGIGKHTAAWKNQTASKIVKNLRTEIDGTFADTYGGIKGLWLNIIYGNIAYDGTESGPIRFNRIPLRTRTPAQISNTIGHELAHRIGLTHPHSNKNLHIANLEPPYVIGDIIEKLINNQLK